MASETGDKKRNQIIGLLYIVFICFSVISIKVSLLDSNTYVISTLKSLDKEEVKRIVVSDKIISDNLELLEENEKASTYLSIAKRIKVSYKVASDLIEYVNKEFEAANSSMLKQFNSKNLISKILKSDNGVALLEKDLFELSDFILSQPHHLDTLSNSLVLSIPLVKNITTIKGKTEDWGDYLFLKKPTAISYSQLERVKLLLSKSILFYQEEALEKIGYSQTYSSLINEKKYNVSVYRDDEILKANQKAVNKDAIVVDDLFKNLLKSLNTDNIYVGIKATILNQADIILKNGIKIEIEPNIKTENRSNTLKGYFNKKGIYTIKFLDVTNNKNIVLFEKTVSALELPNPTISIPGGNQNSFEISKLDLLTASRIEAHIDIENIQSFPGRINKFNIVLVHGADIYEAITNSGPIFQTDTQRVLEKIEDNDLVIFEDVSMTLNDGTTRIAPPIIYKVIEKK
jgi:hypothetical protein|tara:strand:- start:2212 stop:3588 length:1377 start_codon:yes stop_codon:yes gene_type:complete